MSILSNIFRRRQVIVSNQLGHRDYVGGLWDEIGELQFRFLVEHGLKPEHVLLDVACGSLRLGARAVPYLDSGNYLGLDINHELIDAGLKKELNRITVNAKRPEFVVSYAFEFAKFSKQPDFAIAQAIFIHLPSEQIELCLRNLTQIAKSNTKVYATFLEAERYSKSELNHFPYVIYHHTRTQMTDFGKSTGWEAYYIGEWGHPRKQVIVEYQRRVQ